MDAGAGTDRHDAIASAARLARHSSVMSAGMLRDARGRRRVAVGLAIVALAYVGFVVAAAWGAADPGYRVRIGLEVVQVRTATDLAVGERITAIDGAPLRSTLAYSRWRRAATPGEPAVVTVADRRGVTREVTIVPRPQSTPVLLLVTAGFAVLLLGFGLLLRLRAPDDPAARRFWASTLPFPFIYVGAVAAPHVLAEPLAIGGLAIALGLAPAWLRDFFASFPTPGPPPSPRIRGALLASGAAGAAVVIALFASARAGDAALRAGVAGLLALATLNVAVAVAGVRRQWRRARAADPTERAQLKWLLLGFGLVVVHTATIVPGALGDPGWFTAGGFAPLVAGAAICWFGASTLAMLRVRLAAIDAVVPSALLYSAAARGSAIAAALVVITVGTVVIEVAPGATALASTATAIAAAALFGPGRQRLRGWLDTWSRRDRSRYVERLHETTGELATLRDRDALARTALERAVATVHADGGAVYLPAAGDRVRRAHAIGRRAYPDELAVDGAAVPIDGDLLAWPVAGARLEAVLVLGPRLGGDRYGADDRHLLGALAGVLATAFETARASATADDLGARLAARERELRALRAPPADAPAPDGGPLPVLAGSSARAAELRRTIERVAASTASVLLAGETGAGKGMVAHAIHAASARAAGPFVHVDCGAIAAGVFESELFGHERGAFTGADRARAGLLEQADRGTLFLDEIGELPATLQPKLLRALQERSVVRVGGSRPRALDLRVIAATNRDLEAMIRAGAFREDLYFRLRVVDLVVPPLRDRSDDLAAIVDALVPRLARRTGAAITVRPDALAALRRHPWPGNIRELENTLERAVVLTGASAIGAADLALDARRAPRGTEPAPDDPPHRAYLDAVERARLVAALDAAAGNRALAARNLGIPRTTLINKLRRHGIAT